MTEFILTFICAFLSIIGLTEIIHSLKTALLSSKSKPFTELYIYLDEDNPDLQLETYLKSINTLRVTKFFALYSGNDDIEEKCERISQKYNIIFMKK